MLWAAEGSEGSGVSGGVLGVGLVLLQGRGPGWWTGPLGGCRSFLRRAGRGAAWCAATSTRWRDQSDGAITPSRLGDHDQYDPRPPRVLRRLTPLLAWPGSGCDGRVGRRTPVR